MTYQTTTHAFRVRKEKSWMIFGICVDIGAIREMQWDEEACLATRQKIKRAPRNLLPTIDFFLICGRVHRRKLCDLCCYCCCCCCYFLYVLSDVLVRYSCINVLIDYRITQTIPIRVWSQNSELISNYKNEIDSPQFMTC